MNPEERLERIAKLFAKAGLRYRRDLNRLDENINLLVNTQIGNEDRLAIIEQGLLDLSGKTERRFGELAQGQTSADQKLADIMDFLRRSEKNFPLDL